MGEAACELYAIDECEPVDLEIPEFHDLVVLGDAVAVEYQLGDQVYRHELQAGIAAIDDGVIVILAPVRLTAAGIIDVE